MKVIEAMAKLLTLREEYSSNVKAARLRVNEGDNVTASHYMDIALKLKFEINKLENTELK